MKAWVRWALLLPVSVAAWYLAFFVGLLMDSLLDWFCPIDKVVSGLCTATWYEPAFQAIMSLGTMLAAVLIVLSCAWIAPSRKGVVTITAFAVGSTIALALGFQSGAYLAAASAIAGGAVTTGLVWRQQHRQLVV